MTESIPNKESLAILWVNGDPEAAMRMAFMYARNAMANGWWQQVRLIIWGPSASAMRQDMELQDALPKLREAGVEIMACKACAEEYGAEQTLEALGVDVRYTGELLTEMIKSGWHVLSV